MPSFFYFLLFVCFSNSFSFKGEASQDKKELARSTIASLKEELIRQIAYSKDDLKKMKVDFQKEYNQTYTSEKFQQLENHILNSAMHWVDVNGDQKEELIFWTEGFAESSWGPKEFLFVVELRGKKPKILAKQSLSFCSKTQVAYKNRKFLESPNKGKGYNPGVVGAVFSCFHLGVSGSTWHTISIEYNRYEKKVQFGKISTPYEIFFKNN